MNILETAREKLENVEAKRSREYAERMAALLPMSQADRQQHLAYCNYSADNVWNRSSQWWESFSEEYYDIADEYFNAEGEDEWAVIHFTDEDLEETGTTKEYQIELATRFLASQGVQND